MSADILLKQQLSLKFSLRSVALSKLESTLGIAQDDADHQKANESGTPDGSHLARLRLAARRIRESVSDTQRQRAFISALTIIRNSTAHDADLEDVWLSSSDAGPLFDALVCFVPWVVFKLRDLER